MAEKIYVAATNQHIGKTTSTLGLMKALINEDLKVGYCKPVGQEFVDLGDLRVDKDALLFSKTLDFDLIADMHSPVILGKGATSKFLDNPDGFDYKNRILRASKRLEKDNQFVIFEGTGHPGVGSVVGLSNAMVAKLLGASVVMIAKGGIGNTIDRLFLSLAIFRNAQVPIKGVIINKVLPEKMEKVRHYVGNWLKEQGIPLLGVLPFDKSMSNPIIHTIKKAIYGQTMLNGAYTTNQVEGMIAGSLVTTHDFTKEKNLLLVVSSNRIRKSLMSIINICEKLRVKKSPLSGILITGDGQHPGQQFTDEKYIEYCKTNHIPVISTPLDTYGSVVKINNLEVKINIHTPWKARKAIEMVEQNVNLTAFKEKISF